jgi:hypothetical protein
MRRKVMNAEATMLDLENDLRKATECEGLILGVLIWLPPFAPGRMEHVRLDDFQDGRHRVLFEALKALHAERKEAGLPEILEWLSERNLLEAAGGRAYVTRLVDEAIMNGAYQYESYVAALRERNWGGGSKRISTKGNEGNEEEGTARNVQRSAPDVQCRIGNGTEESLTEGAEVLDELKSQRNSTEGNEEEGSCNSPLRKEEKSLTTTDEEGSCQPMPMSPVSKEQKEPGNCGAELLDELKGLFERYVILPPNAAEVLALWTLHTYAWPLRRVTTYLAVVSPKKRCGKTTLLTLLDKLVCRPQFASNISPPAIFRAIEETQPTLLIDEADTFLDGSDEFRGILNAGYRRESAYVLRATGEGQNLRRFSCWCPKVIASIGSLPDTLADRCVIINIRRKTAAEKCERLGDLDTLLLFQRCRAWVGENEAMIQSARPAIPEGLNDRAADIWEPLFVLADLAGGKWPEVARAAALSLSAGSDDEDVSALLLGDIRKIFRVAKVDRLFSRHLVDGLTRIMDRPWREIRRGGPINELWLAQQLAPFEIYSRSVRIGDFTSKGYALEDFQDAFARYLPKER